MKLSCYNKSLVADQYLNMIGLQKPQLVEYFLENSKQNTLVVTFSLWIHGCFPRPFTPRERNQGEGGDSRIASRFALCGLDMFWQTFCQIQVWFPRPKVKKILLFFLDSFLCFFHELAWIGILRFSVEVCLQGYEVAFTHWFIKGYMLRELCLWVFDHKGRREFKKKWSTNIDATFRMWVLMAMSSA